MGTIGSAFSNSNDFDLSKATGQYKLLKKSLATDDLEEIDKEIKNILDKMNQIYMEQIIEPREITAFFNDDLRDIVKIIMNKQYKMSRELRIMGVVEPFLLQVLQFSVKMLPTDNPTIIEILQMLLNPQATYYSYSSFTPAREIIDELYKNYPLVCSICPAVKKAYNEGFNQLNTNYEAELERVLDGRNPEENSLFVKTARDLRNPGINFINDARIFQKTSLLYLLNVNYFLQINGHQRLLEFIKRCRMTSHMLVGIEIFIQIHSFLDDAFYKTEVLPNFLNGVQCLPLSLNHEEPLIGHAKKDEIVQFTKTLKNIAKNASDWPPLVDKLIGYELEALLICLKSQYLDKRIYAISTFVEKISESERGGTKGLFRINQPQISLSKENYLEWLEEKDIMSVLLGESSHSELLRRSSPLFRFLFKNKRLSIEKIDFICQLAFEKHDTFRKQILKILVDLIELMDYSELEHLFEKLSEISIQEIDQDFLQLIKTIGNNISIMCSPTSWKKRTLDGTDGLGLFDTDKNKQKPQWTSKSVFEGFNQESIDQQQQQVNEIGKRKGPELDIDKEDGVVIEDLSEEKRRNLGQKVLDFLWKIILELPDVKSGNATLVTTATNILKDILNGKLESEKVRFLEKTVNAIKKNISVNESFEILTQIFKGKFPIDKRDGTYFANKKELIQHLETEFQLSNTIFNSLILLKKGLVSFLGDNENNTIAGNNIQPPPAGMEEEDRLIKEEQPQIEIELANETNQSTQMLEEEPELLIEETKEMERNTISTDVSSIDGSHDGAQRAGRKPYFLMKTNENPSVSEVINLYIKEIENRLRFVRMLKASAFEQLEYKHANLLWSLLAENAVYEQEREAFFAFFTNIIHSSSSNEYNILSEDIINYVFSDILQNLDFCNYSLQTFNCFIEFFKYLNIRYSLLTPNQNSFIVQSLELIGIDSLWDLFFQSTDPQVVSKAQEFLLSLFKRVAEKKKRATLVETCIKHIEKAYKNITEKLPGESSSNDSFQRISRCLDFISTFLQESGELQAQSNLFSADNAVNVIIFNQMNNAMQPKKFTLTLYKTMTVKEAKELIASRLNPPMAANDVMLMSRGQIIEGDNILIEDLPWKIENEHTIICSKNTAFDDLDYAQESSTTAVVEDTPEFLEKVDNLKGFFPDLDDDFLKFVLRRKNGDVDTVAMTLFDPEEQESLKNQHEKEQQKHKKKVQTKKEKTDDDIRLSELLANNDEIFELFFKLLTLDVEDLSTKVWDLLMNLPLNKNLYLKLRNIFQNNSSELDWNTILHTETPPKLLYSLRIIFNLINCNILEQEDPELYIKSGWRLNFLEYQGVNFLQDLLFKFPEDLLLKKNTSQNQSSHNMEARILSLTLEILTIYIRSALIASASEGHHKLIDEVVASLEKDKVSTKSASAEKTKKPWLFGKDSKDKKLNTSPPKEEKKTSSLWGDSEVKWPSPVKPPTEQKGLLAITNGEAWPEYPVNPIKDTWENPFKTATEKMKAQEPMVVETPKVDEAEAFLTAMKEDGGRLAKKILENIDFEKFVEKGLRIVEKSLERINNDKDLVRLVLDEFTFMLPCFVAYSRLLKLLYKHKEIQYIIKMVFFTCHQESVKDIVTYMIMFLSKNSQLIIGKDDDFFKDQMEVEGAQPESLQSFFLKILLPLAFNCQLDEDISFEYFEIIVGLIRIMNKEAINAIADVSKLYIFSIKFIKERPIFENRSADTTDKVLRGFLKLAETLLQIEPSLQNIFDTPNELTVQAGLQGINLLRDLYDFLFYLPGENEKVDPALNLPKCKHKKTRAQVFSLMKALSFDNQTNLNKTLDLLALNHQNLPNFAAEYNSSALVNFELKNATGYVGLKNLGCTCYMNSLLQQFFMLQPLRNAILGSEVLVKIPGPTDDKEEEVYLTKISPDVYDTNEKYLETQLVDNVLYQLQRLFGQLEESVSESVVPQRFFDSIKTINGEKIVVNIQQDVNEFFNTLCDKLEQCMKNTPQKNLLNDLIGGTLSHEIISLETDYPYYGEREEAYLTIPLDIKNKRNIYEALDFYVKEDILEGDNKYHCEQYDRKIKVMKRCCIKSLPNTLIITLKRFDFDFVSMQKVKINDYFEFPTTLNVKPWTKAGLKDQIPAEANYEPPNHEDDFYDYELVGVLVHSGTADAGHYYSYIKDRGDGKKGWFEFNDNRVKPFDIKNLKNECFGSDSVDSKSSIYDFEFVRTRSAYILFYEKVSPQTEADEKYKVTGVPQSLCNTIWRENLELLRSKYFYDVDYFKFVMELFRLYKFPAIFEIPESYSEPSEMPKLRREAEKTQKIIKAMERFESTGETQDNLDAIKPEDNISLEEQEENEDQYLQYNKTLRLAIVLASEIYMKNKDSDLFDKWMKLVQEALEHFIPGNIWLLKFVTQYPRFLKLLYGESSASTVKDAVKELITRAINKAQQIEAPFFDQEEEFKICNAQYKIELKTVRKSALARFIKVFVESFFKGKRDLSKPLEYFNIIIYLLESSQMITRFLIFEGLLIETFDLFMQAQKVLNAAFSATSSKEKDKYHPSNVVFLFKIIDILLRSCITTTMFETKTLPPSCLFDKENLDWDSCPKIPDKIIDRIIEAENFNKFFLALHEKSGSNNLYLLLQHISWQNQDSTKKIIHQIISQICGFMVNARAVEENIQIIYHLLILNDEFQAFRIECLFAETQTKTLLSAAKGQDLYGWLKKGKDNYDKNPCIVTLRWMSKMTQDIPAFKQHLLQNVEKLDWVLDFLEDNMHSKKGFVTIMDSEMKTKIPLYLQKSFEIFSEILPYDDKPRVEAEAVNMGEDGDEDQERENYKKTTANNLFSSSSSFKSQFQGNSLFKGWDVNENSNNSMWKGLNEPNKNKAKNKEDETRPKGLWNP